MKKIIIVLLVFSCVLIANIGFYKYANANILITPTRVVFEGRNRYADVTLVNNGSKKTRYEIEWVYQKMNKDTGLYSVVDNLGDEFDLSKYITFSPRRVELAPGAKQKIRLALHRPSDVADGDYHVHLKFKALPEDTDDSAKVGGAMVRINVSYTIPVILRVGKVNRSASIGEINLQRNKDTGLLDLYVPVKRLSDKYAVLGYLWVYHVDGDKEELVGELSNAHIFPEIDKRTFKVLLRKDIKGGSLKVVLRYFDKNNDYIYDEKVFDLE